MPELPEIEALRRYLLREGLVGRTVVEVDDDWPGVEDTVDGMGGLSGLIGRRVEGIERRGKQLILPLVAPDEHGPLTLPRKGRHPALSRGGERGQGGGGDDGDSVDQDFSLTPTLSRWERGQAEGDGRSREEVASSPDGEALASLTPGSSGLSHRERGSVSPDGGVLGLHMGMTGRLGVMAPEDESFRYRRLALYLDDERRLELDDVRRWAMVRLEDTAEAFTSGMGPDALDPEFTAAQFIERVSVKRSPIKSVLLDQKVLAGVGNIYADEVLLIVGIAPSRRADKISAGRLESLHSAIVGVLENALAFIESHPDDQGRPYVIDAQDDRMQIPRSAGAPCPQCDTALKSRKFGGRTAYYCPSCQH